MTNSALRPFPTVCSKYLWTCEANPMQADIIHIMQPTVGRKAMETIKWKKIPTRSDIHLDPRQKLKTRHTTFSASVIWLQQQVWYRDILAGCLCFSAKFNKQRGSHQIAPSPRFVESKNRETFSYLRQNLSNRKLSSPKCNLCNQSLYQKNWIPNYR